MKDILLFMSDQHTPVLSSFSGGMARTPNLESIAENGTVFDAAYTSCPLCVPARMSFMSGRLPSKTGIMNNYSVLPDTMPTIAHAFAAAGYETVLMGRMHFVGEDQRHGFHHRFVGDITSTEWKPTRAHNLKNRGPLMTCFDERGCTDVIGGGGSAVQQYDSEVVAAALEYLSRDHEKPQFIVVGTYGPHFPYVAPLEKYRYYLDKVEIPWGYGNPPSFIDPCLQERIRRSSHDEETVKRATAAYLALSELTDEYVGKIREAFSAYKKRTGREGVFCYTSDHGDQVGEKGLYAKMSFFEKSSRIPLLMEGEGIAEGERRKDPVSIMDLVPTLCALADVVPPPCQDGEDFLSPSYDREGRSVISETWGIFGAPGKFPEVEHMNSVSRMVRKGKWKFITRAMYEDWDILFDLETDPEERVNVIKDHPEVAEELRKEIENLPSNESVKATMKQNWQVYDFMQTAQKPSERVLSEFWSGTTEENLRVPEKY